MPETPAPVPISTTERAEPDAVSRRSTVPTPGRTPRQPSSSPRARARATTSSSSTKVSAYAQLAGVGALIGTSWAGEWRRRPGELVIRALVGDVTLRQPSGWWGNVVPGTGVAHGEPVVPCPPPGGRGAVPDGEGWEN